MHQGQGTTLKEGFNLLQGRAVYKELANKEGENYQGWLQLDFGQRQEKGNYKMNQYHQNYGFDLEKALSAHPIKELHNEAQKELLLHSLQKGNITAVTLEQKGRPEKVFVEANPKFKTLQFYDEAGKKLNHQFLAERYCFEPSLEKRNGTAQKELSGKAAEKQQEAKGKFLSGKEMEPEQRRGKRFSL